MGKNSTIEWTDHTFNPWIGCRKVSPGCNNCYITDTTPFRVRGMTHGSDRQRTGTNNWKLPLRWNRDGSICPSCGKPWDVDMCARCLGESHRPRVFCASLADWLDDEVSPAWLADLLQLIGSTPNLDWLLLTKRPQLWRERLQAAVQLIQGDWTWVIDWMEGKAPANVWVGVSTENSTWAHERHIRLMKIPAKVHFWSAEPLLDKINASQLWERHGAPEWVICGGESGRNARSMHPDWARSLRDQCRAVGVPFFFKQWGEYAPCIATAGGIIPFSPEEWARVERGEYVGTYIFERVGKKVAGRLLDGREWNEFPCMESEVAK